MGLHKLEIEVTDELLSRIDSVSERTSNSRADVILGALKAQFPDQATEGSLEDQRPAKARLLDRLFDEASRRNICRSDDSILEEIRIFRGDL
jgi:metal-responsive CopG/Arc/MetJ family transcriptional regulator